MIIDFAIIMFGVAGAYATMGVLSLVRMWIGDTIQNRRWKKQGNRPRIVCPTDCSTLLP